MADRSEGRKHTDRKTNIDTHRRTYIKVHTETDTDKHRNQTDLSDKYRYAGIEVTKIDSDG